jgi:hypothetical protein
MATTSLEEALDNNVAEIMDAEDPLFILYIWFYRKAKRNGTYHSRVYGLYRIYI